MTGIPQLLAKTGDGLFAIDRHQRIIFWNPAAQSVFGLTEDEAIGRHCYEVLRGCDSEGQEVCGPDCWVFQAVARQEEVPSQELCLRRADGRVLGCSFSVITIDDAGDDAQAIVMFRPTNSAGPSESPAPAGASSPADDLVRSQVGIRCFGTFEVRVNGELLTGPPLSRGKARKALRYLVHRRGHKVQRDELAEVVWPGGNADATRRGLKVLIHELRHALEPDLAPYQDSSLIRYEDDSYCFASSERCWIDVDAFLRHVKEGQRRREDGSPEKAQDCFSAAVGAYRGVYLAEDLYEDWCSGERERLRELHLSALTALASTLAAQREFARAAEYCRQALADDGCRETTYRALMGYLWEDGRGHEALVAFRRCCEVLGRELGVAPMAETIEVYRGIRRALSRA